MGEQHPLCHWQHRHGGHDISATLREVDNDHIVYISSVTVHCSGRS